MFPVIENVSIDIQQTKRPFVSWVYLDFVKTRGRCAFESINFDMMQVDQDGGILKNRLTAKNLSEEVVRGAGAAKAGPWELNASKYNLKFVEVLLVHNCHPFWKTKTSLTFYDGVLQ